MKEGVEFYDELDIVDKAYLMIGFCLYNIRPRVQVMQVNLGPTDLPLTLLLDNIEKAYKRDMVVECQSGKLTFKASYPRKYEVEDGEIQVDYLDGIKSVVMDGKEYRLSEQEKQTLFKKMSGKDLLILSNEIQENLSIVVNLAEGVYISGFTTNIVSPSLFHIALSAIKLPLEEFYNLEYIMVQHVRIGRGDYMDMSPIECSILLNKFVEEKKKQNEEMEQARQQHESRF